MLVLRLVIYCKLCIKKIKCCNVITGYYYY